MRWLRRDREGQRIALDVGAGERDRCRRVLVRGGCRGGGDGCVVDRCDGDRDRCGLGVECAVVGRERERISPVEVRGRCVGEVRRGAAQCAVGRRSHDRERQWVGTSPSVAASTIATASSSLVVTFFGSAVGGRFWVSLTVSVGRADLAPVAGEIDAANRHDVRAGGKCRGDLAAEAARRQSHRKATTGAGIRSDPPLAAGETRERVRRRGRDLCGLGRRSRRGIEHHDGVVGDVRSTFTVCEVVAVSPATSVAVPLSTSAVPSWKPVEAGGGHDVTPDTESLQANVAVTRHVAPSVGVRRGRQRRRDLRWRGVDAHHRRRGGSVAEKTSMT